MPAVPICPPRLAAYGEVGWRPATSQGVLLATCCEEEEDTEGGGVAGVVVGLAELV
jgi:hypothetical protein